MDPVFFPTSADFRAWLEEHHQSADELWVGFYKKGTGRASVTYPEAVDQALCFGWIDGVRKGIDADSYTNRFTPRRARSIWSAVNVKRFGELEAEGLVAPAGRAAFERRREDRTGIYSYDRADAPELGEEYERRLRENRKAWEFWEAQPPGYRRTATHWVVSAKKEETRLRRLAQLIEDSQHGRRIGPLARPSRKG